MKEIFQLADDQSETSEKVVSLSEALGRTVNPGMKLHLNSGAYANAAIREIIRQYWDKSPAFTLISSGVTTPFEIGLACSGLVRKVITTNHSHIYPTPRPIPLLQQMHQEGRLEIEIWSLYALEQRLMAAATGVGFLPTKSMMGTSLGEENRDAFKVIANPFEPEKKIGAVKALAPDISMIHGCVADREGNVILAPPYFTSLWGPKASRCGVIVTVEKIVSREFIRKHSALVKIPGHLVTFVCPVPHGAHPQGLAAESIGVSKGYREDYEFILESLEAGHNSDNLRKWLEKWVIQCPEHDDYLEKIGTERLAFLREKSGVEPMNYKDLKQEPAPVSKSDFNSTEMMVVAAAREIKEVVSQREYKTILAGIGSPGLAAWLAFYLLKAGGRKVSLLTGVGLVGYAPRPGDPFLMTLSNVMTCSMLTDAVEIYGTFVGGANKECLSVLGTAQIDQYGNLNTVRIGNLPFIGVGGAGDAVNAKETLVIAKQSPKRFLERLPYVGCPGKNIKTLVTDLGVFEKLGEEDTFTLTKFFHSSSTGGREDRIRRIGGHCGWPLKVAHSLEEVSSPTSFELGVLRSMDPARFFLGKT